MAQSGALTIDGTKVPVSNLDKSLYPIAKFTKAQVIDYYIRAAQHLLPHLKDRPVTLKRYPDGVGAEHFYEKDAPSFKPEWVRTFPVPRRNGGPDIQYVLINDLRTLVWCANLANLEIHPFLHRAPYIDRPTHVVFDLDPGEGADVIACAEVAILLRDVLEEAGLRSFAKVSGSKGIQLYVPLNTPISYAETQPFAKALAEMLAKAQPGRITAEMPKELRRGKVFIDWSQNSDFKTTVGVYSLRAKRAHPFVSLPVTWQELEQAAQSGESAGLYYQPEAALERMTVVGDLFEPVLRLKQSLPGTRLVPVKHALKQYAAKRNFTRTAEPEGSDIRRSKQGSRRRFVIQKHAARHLHYDFRLEMHDVLKSWAVPKGVPYALEERRLAAATEDHPIEYLDFEGTIPEGQYGGGTVMVWDIGTYELIEGNYYKGRLHFHLSGKKLNGEWMLTRDAPDAKNWRLTKAGAASKPVSTKKDDQSALTGRTMKQIAEAADAQWQSNRTRAGIDLEPLPSATLEFIEPMQAKAVDSLPEGQAWRYEVKFDGYRTVAIRSSERVLLVSRNNKPLNDRFPAIADALSAAEHGTVFDGEVVALDAEGHPSFHVLQNHLTRKTQVQYYVFDLLAYRGKSLLHLPLEQRRALLEKDALVALADPVFLSRTVNASPDELVHAAREQGFEGIVAKRANSVYEPGKRSGAWVKLRVNKGQELIVGGYKPGTSGFDYLLVGYYNERDELIFVAKLKNGFTPKTKAEVVKRFRGLETKTCPFANLPEPKNARRGEAITADVMKVLRWLRPHLVVETEFVDWTDANHLRHAKFTGVRDDKEAQEVRKEF